MPSAELDENTGLHGILARYQAELGSVCQPSSAWRTGVETRIEIEMSSPGLRARRARRVDKVPAAIHLPGKIHHTKGV